ncbi:hypothetical protein [Mycobacterium servetii]|uniref:Uncharacterized protein n=1 Tax=Mycobacterium servetii TaxID=3237418 RepID=A0ABV4C6E1_9MYCO
MFVIDSILDIAAITVFNHWIFRAVCAYWHELTPARRGQAQRSARDKFTQLFGEIGTAKTD